ncbi:MAG: zinc ribbon domain-containing protein, partial [Myxococcota bacterium]
MPIYEYECEKCGEVFEVFQKVSDPPPKSHSCGSRKVRRLISRTSFVLKGTGWYVTDYARKEQSVNEKADGSKGSSSSDSSDNRGSKSGDKSSDKSSDKS